MHATMATGRRLVVRLLAVLGLLSFSFMLVFVVGDASGPTSPAGGLEPPGSIEAAIGAEHPDEAAHVTGAVAALAIGAIGLGGLLIRPERAGSGTQTAAAAFAMLITAVLVGNPDNYGQQAGMIDPAFAILALPPLAAALTAAPWRGWGSPSRHRRTYIALAILGAPLLWYGVDQGMMQRNTWPPLADPHHQAHWWAMSLLSWLIVLTIGGAALGGRGWRIGAATSGLAAVAVAASSLAVPAAASALGAGWAVATLVWGFTVVAVTWRNRRGEPGDGEPLGSVMPGDVVPTEA